MQPFTEQFSVVLVGSWNIGLFTPTWTSENLFSGVQPEIELGITTSGATTRQRYGNLAVTPTRNRMSINVLGDPLREWKTAVQTANTMCDILNHTPVSSLGVNFGFTSESTDRLLHLFTFNDTTWISAAGAETDSTFFRRSLRIDDFYLNLSFLKLPDDLFQIDANFHFEVNDITDAGNQLGRCLTNNVIDKLLSFMKHAYELEIEEPEEEEFDHV